MSELERRVAEALNAEANTVRPSPVAWIEHERRLAARRRKKQPLRMVLAAAAVCALAALGVGVGSGRDAGLPTLAIKLPPGAIPAGYRIFHGPFPYPLAPWAGKDAYLAYAVSSADPAKALLCAYLVNVASRVEQRSCVPYPAAEDPGGVLDHPLVAVFGRTGLIVLPAKCGRFTVTDIRGTVVEREVTFSGLESTVLLVGVENHPFPWSFKAYDKEGTHLLTQGVIASP